MTAVDLFRNQAVLEGAQVRLVQLDGRWFEQVSAGLQDTEMLRLTGTHASFTRPQIQSWLDGRPEQTRRR